MDTNERKRINQNIDKLINFTDYEKLKYACVNTELLSHIMVRNVHHVEPSTAGEPYNEDSITRERHKKLFQKITQRGPTAYEKLLLILQDLQFNEALAILLAGYDDDRIRNTNNIEGVAEGSEANHQLERINSIDDDNTLHEYNGDISPKKTVAVKKSLRICKHHSIETYPMESKDTRGVFFMVNIVDFPMSSTLKQREGADEDAHALLHLFRELGFKLFYYRNITQDFFWKLLKELLNSEYTKHTECFVMTLMTHGNMKFGVQHITFGDGSLVKVKDIEQHFYHHICPNLKHKPKVFLFPFCRGVISEKSIRVPKNIETDGVNFGVRVEKNIETDRVNFEVIRISHLSDVCVCYATSEDYRAHRHRYNGSWYIQYFVKNMAELAHDTAFEDIIKKVQADTLKERTANENLQTANYVNKSFNKILYFNPGFHKT